MTGQLWPAWLFLAVAVALTAVPSAAAARIVGLTGGGRLLGRSPTDRRVALPATRAALLAATTVVTVIAVAGGVPIALAAAAVLVAAGVLARDARATRADRCRHRELLTAVGVLAGELAAGARPASALAAAAGTSTAMGVLLGPAATVAAEGGDAAAVLSTESEVRAIGLAWRLVEATGAGLAAVIERVAADLADRDVQRRTVAVVLAGPRSSAMLLSVLPLIGIALGTAMGAAPVPYLLGDPVGQWLCCAGVLLDVAGVLWIRRIVRRAETP